MADIEKSYIYIYIYIYPACEHSNPTEIISLEYIYMYTYIHWNIYTCTLLKGMKFLCREEVEGIRVL